jgi:hypothetical protein
MPNAGTTRPAPPLAIPYLLGPSRFLRSPRLLSCSTWNSHLDEAVSVLGLDQAAEGRSGKAQVVGADREVRVARRAGLLPGCADCGAMSRGSAGLKVSVRMSPVKPWPSGVEPPMVVMGVSPFLFGRPHHAASHTAHGQRAAAAAASTRISAAREALGPGEMVVYMPRRLRTR